MSILLQHPMDNMYSGASFLTYLVDTRKVLIFEYVLFIVHQIYKYHHQNQKGKRWQGLKVAPSLSGLVAGCRNLVHWGFLVLK